MVNHDEKNLLSTPVLCDACLRLDIPLRPAPSGIASIPLGARVEGSVLPVRHVGSVDVLLEAIDSSRPGDLLVVDNGGRVDEACIGDLIAREAQFAGIVGIVVWGAHRDTEELEAIGLPIFSYGAYPAGPSRLEPRPNDALGPVRFGGVVCSRQDVVVADRDGAIFIPRDRYSEVVSVANEIHQIERHQAEVIASGKSLREQLDFSGFMSRLKADPSWTFRKHLRAIGGAIEE